MATKARSGWMVSLLVGMAGAAIGLAPWLSTGEKLPLQNSWQKDTLPADMPWAALPLNQYYLVSILGLIVFGALLCGLASFTRFRKSVVLLGLVIVQGLAVAQSFTTLRSGLDTSRGADAYFWIVLSWVAITLILGLTITLLLAYGSPAGQLIALVLAAIPSAYWLSSWLVLSFELNYAHPSWAGLIHAWAPAIIVALALIWHDWRTESSLLKWVITGMVLVVLSMVTTGIRDAGMSLYHSRGNFDFLLQEASSAALRESGAAASSTLAALAIGWIISLIIRRSAN